MRRSLLLFLLAATALLLAAPRPAEAVEYTVNFTEGPELGTPITNEYLDDAFVQFFADDFGFRPARRMHGKVQQIAADVGPSRCQPDGGEGSDCEFVIGGTTFQLSRTATSLTLDAGLFAQPGQTATAQLKAYRAGENTPVAVSAETPLPWVFFPIGVDNIETPLTVSRPAGDIQRVELVVGGPGATGAEVGFDDLVIDYPANQVPDVALSAAAGPHTLYQGGSVDIPISVVRVNGSDGDLSATVEGLPPGVTGAVLPDPVAGTGSTATLRLTAADDVAPFFEPDAVTVTMTPAGAGVAPAPRSVDVSFTVRVPFVLDREATGPIAVPQCAPADTLIVLNRDVSWAVDRTVTLSIESAPAGVTASFSPDPVVGPVGTESGPTVLRLTRPASPPLNPGQNVIVRAESPGAPTRRVVWPVSAAQPTAVLDSTTLRGSVPQRLQPGSRIRLSGNGFCPGTKVAVGNNEAVVDTEPDPDAPGTGLYFRVPRLGTTGAVKVLPPPAGTPGYDATPALTVGSVRNSDAFSFKNFGWGNLSFDELTDLVGTSEMFYRPNPCWPIYDCSLPTPIPDPIAYIKWQAIEQAAQSSGGHCFGISRFLQEVGAGRIRPSDFAAGVGRIYDLSQSSVDDYLDHRHAGQFTAQFIARWFTREKSVAAQLDRARSELAAGRLPGIIVKKSLTSGHVVTAYDIEDRPDGSTVIWVYDNNVPFEPGENAQDGASHKAREERSRIVINAAKTIWSFNGYDGGGNFFYTTLLTDWPAGTDPSLPGIDTILGAVIFGSPDGSATLEGVSEGADVLPALDENAVPGAGGAVIAQDGPIRLDLVGRKKGEQQQDYFGPNGFVGSLRSPTDAGVKDAFTADGEAQQVTFAGSMTRPVELQVGTDGDAGSRLATVETRSAAGGSDAVAMKGGALVYEHDGPATTATVTLASAADGRGVGQFTSGPVKVRKDETLTITPGNWNTLESARVVGTSKAGRRVRRVRSTGRGMPVRVTLTGVRVTGTTAQVAVRFAKVPEGATAGVVVRLQRGRRVVARRGTGVADLVDGKRTFTFELPRLRKGPYRLRADVIVSSTRDALGTRRASRTVRVGR